VGIGGGFAGAPPIGGLFTGTIIYSPHGYYFPHGGDL
jgi:hypothetical protein